MRRNKIIEIIKYFIKNKFEAEGTNKNQKKSRKPIYLGASKIQKKIQYNGKQNKNINSVNIKKSKKIEKQKIHP